MFRISKAKGKQGNSRQNRAHQGLAAKLIWQNGPCWAQSSAAAMATLCGVLQHVDLQIAPGSTSTLSAGTPMRKRCSQSARPVFQRQIKQGNSSPGKSHEWQKLWVVLGTEPCSMASNMASFLIDQRSATVTQAPPALSPDSSSSSAAAVPPSSSPSSPNGSWGSGALPPRLRF